MEIVTLETNTVIALTTRMFGARFIAQLVSYTTESIAVEALFTITSTTCASSLDVTFHAFVLCKIK